MNDPERRFMEAINDPKTHAPPGYRFEPAPVEQPPVTRRDDVVVYPVLPGGVLHYRPPEADRRQARGWVQALRGFLACLLVTAAINFFAPLLIGQYTDVRGGPIRATLVRLTPLALFAIPGQMLRSRRIWPAFLPGALAGWAVAALVEGVCFVWMANL